MLQTYNSGVAFVFHMSEGSESIVLNYVGVLKDILKLNYGPLCTLVILCRCEWMKHCNNWGNLTYVINNVVLMVVNFCHKVPKMSEPFIFPNQATQVFWSEEVDKPRWKVMLAKEACARRHEQRTTNVFIIADTQADAMHIEDRVNPSPTSVSLVGAIELLDANNLLALAKF